MIAAYNLADMRFDRSDARMDGFFDNVERMNALADRSEGFLWRLIHEPDEAAKAEQVTGTRLTTLSVWESPTALGNYVFNTLHVQFYLRRASWFENLSEAHFCMWTHTGPDWPTEDEAQARLAHFNQHGSTDYAFGWDRVDTSRWPRRNQKKEAEHV